MAINSDVQMGEDFTEREYRELLQIAKQRYRFVGYGEDAGDQPTIIWRHDIDVSPHRARALARIEAEEGVRSTFFVLLHSELYNALEGEIAGILRELPRHGHELGLHFDASFWPDAEARLEERLRFERSLLETVFDVPIRSFAWHNGDLAPFVKSIEDDVVAGMINVYGRTLRQRSYCSDSNGIWRFRRLRDVLTAAEEPHLHVLTHAEWWVPEVMTPRERIRRAIEGRAARQQAVYDDILQRTGRPNVG